MASDPAPYGSEPRLLLAATRELTTRVLRDQRGGWFPLLVFAAVTFLAIPFDRYGHRDVSHCTSIPGGGRNCSVYIVPGLWYWPVALLLAYGAISWFYLHRSRQQGIGTRTQPYIMVGVILVLLVTTWTLWAVSHPSFAATSPHLGPWRSASYNRLATPAAAMGLALLLLARIERSWPLLAVTAVYLVVAVATVGIGSGGFAHPTPWAFLPHVLIDGAVLLLSGIGLAANRRSHQQRPAA
jgi:hypothetical protein